MTFWFRDFCHFCEGFGEFGLGKKCLGFGFGKIGLEKKSQFQSQKIWSPKNVSVSVLEKLVSEKSLGFGKFGLKKSLRFCFGKLVLGKEKLKITREKLDQVNSTNLLFEF